MKPYWSLLVLALILAAGCRATATTPTVQPLPTATLSPTAVPPPSATPVSTQPPVAGDRNPAGPRPIRQQLDWAVRWGEKLDKPLWMGEFGAYSKADMPSRARWTAFMRQEAEARGITWAYWEFGAGFGVYDRGTQRWNEELVRSLIPEP